MKKNRKLSVKKLTLELYFNRPKSHNTDMLNHDSVLIVICSYVLIYIYASDEKQRYEYPTYKHK